MANRHQQKKRSARAEKTDALLAKMTPADRASASRAIRTDSWFNAVSDMRSFGHDKRFAPQFNIDLNERTLGEWEELYRGNSAAANIADAGPEVMTREGWKAAVQDDEDGDIADAVLSAEEDLDVVGRVEDAFKKVNYQGGAGILMGLDDGRPVSAPLNEDAIRSFRWMKVLSPRELWVKTYYQDAGEPKFGEPELYQVVNVDGSGNDKLGGAGGLIHESRIIRFEGVITSFRNQVRLHGWGDPTLLRCSDALRHSGMSWEGAAKLMADFSQAMLRIKGLAEAVADDGDETVGKRAQALNMARSISGLLLLDSEEEFKRETIPLSGFPEMLQQQMLELASAARMPVTVLMGQAPAGLNATGDSDIRNWYDQCRSKQVRKLKPQLLRIWKMLFLSKDGPTGGEEPENYTVTFNPLYQLTSAEQADLRLKQSQTDVAYVNAGILKPTLIAVQRFAGPEYSTDTRLSDADVKELEEADQLDADTADLAAEARQKQLGDQLSGKAEELQPGTPGALKQLPAGGAANQDAAEDQPRDENGRWTEGGGGGGGQGPRYSTGLPANAVHGGGIANSDQLKDPKSLSTHQLVGLYDKITTGQNIIKVMEGPEFKTVAKELKKRGVTTLQHAAEVRAIGPTARGRKEKAPTAPPPRAKPSAPAPVAPKPASPAVNHRPPPSAINAAAEALPQSAKFGDEKAFISETAYAMKVPLEAFKAHVLDLHQKGEIKLSRADLVEAMDPKQVRESETVRNYGVSQATFHFIRFK